MRTLRYWLCVLLRLSPQREDVPPARQWHFCPHCLLADGARPLEVRDELHLGLVLVVRCTGCLEEFFHDDNRRDFCWCEK